MRAYVVYESLWGNTAAVARAIAEGLGEGAAALSTAEATPDLIADADLIVAGAPSHDAGLSTDRTRQEALASAPVAGAKRSPDLSHPSMRNWLEQLPHGTGLAAGFDTRLGDQWTPGPVKKISRGLRRNGFRTIDIEKFVVRGHEGHLAEGELERARTWGKLLGDEARH